MKRARYILSWLFLIGGLLGHVLAVLRILAPDEPQVVLHLSLLAITIEGFNSIGIHGDD